MLMLSDPEPMGGIATGVPPTGPSAIESPPETPGIGAMEDGGAPADDGGAPPTGPRDIESPPLGGIGGVPEDDEEMGPSPIESEPLGGEGPEELGGGP